MKFIQLSNGHTIPQMGVGTWTLKDKVASENVKLALRAGFRHIDTAQAYDNEAAVGRGITESRVPREEIFLTTKVSTINMRKEAYDIRQSIVDSMEKLQTSYLDLLLIHWPVKDCVPKTWRVMEELVQEGKIRSLGVSNFQPASFGGTAQLRPNQASHQSDRGTSSILKHREYHIQPIARHTGAGLGAIWPRRHRCNRTPNNPRVGTTL